MLNQIYRIIRAKGEDVSYNKHSTQINLYDCCSEKDFNFHWTQKLIKDEDVYREYPKVKGKLFREFLKDDPKEEYGFERNPHITVLYGIQDEADYFDMRKKLKNFGPIDFKISDISSFRDVENPYDVIILKIESEKLHKVHEFLKETYENDWSYPKYNPHMTLAYVKKGKCLDIEGPCDWTGKSYKCPLITFSHKDKYFLPIPLLL